MVRRNVLGALAAPLILAPTIAPTLAQAQTARCVSPSCTMTGTRPFGLICRNAGDCVPPLPNSTVMRSCGVASSARTACVTLAVENGAQ